MSFQKSDIAFVTGGGSGIGRSACKLLAEQGATVVVADINKDAADDTLHSLAGENHLSVQLDVTKRNDVIDAINSVIVKYSSPPNIAVNCAGAVQPSSLLNVTEEQFNLMFDVNVKGTLWVTQEVCQQLVKNERGGAIVNISSILKNGSFYMPIYAATKGAVMSLTLSAAKEFGPKGIRVNAVAPGFINTPMNKTALGNPRLKEAWTQKITLQRIGRPEEVAEAIVFLASEKSSFINGTILDVNGGVK